MSAMTKPNVELNDREWTMISAADVQSLQLIRGDARVAWADTKPNDSVGLMAMGHPFTEALGGWIYNPSSGTSWGRASGTIGAVVAVTEG